MIDDYDNEDYDYFKEWDIEQYKQEIERLNKERENDIKYNKYLQKELAKSNNIIKEVREYILTHKLYCFKYDEEELFEITTDKKAKDELLEILEKAGDEK